MPQKTTTDDKIKITIGETIREVRKAKRYTQTAIAKEVGYTKSTLSKIESGEIMPTIDMLIKLTKALGIDLSYILRNTLHPKDYELAVTKSFIERFVRITTLKEYFNGSDSMILDADEFVYSVLRDSKDSLILQMDKTLLDFFGEIAEAKKLKQELEDDEYEKRILAVLRKLHGTEPGKDVKSYCLASIEDIRCMIDRAVKTEVKGLCAIETALREETTN